MGDRPDEAERRQEGERERREIERGRNGERKREGNDHCRVSRKRLNHISDSIHPDPKETSLAIDDHTVTLKRKPISQQMSF